MKTRHHILQEEKTMYTNNTTHRLNKTFTTALALGLLVTAPALAAEEAKPTANLTVAALSQYIFRGFEQGKDSLVIEPSLTVGYEGFSANLWGNLDTDRTGNDASHWQETDLTLAYAYTIGKVGLSAGYIYYGYGLNNEDTQEFYVSTSYDTLLKPTLAVYRDTDHYAGWYITAAVSHALPLTDKLKLDLGAKASYLQADDASSYSKRGLGEEPCDGFHDGVLSASINFPVNTYITVTPQLAYSFPLTSMAADLIKSASFNGEDSSFIYGGVAVSLAF